MATVIRKDRRIMTLLPATLAFARRARHAPPTARRLRLVLVLLADDNSSSA